MFHITPKVAVLPSLGPLLLVHGMFSTPLDFLTRTDLGTNATPLQLSAMGYDVWIGCTRGREITLGHTTLDLADPVQNLAYWDFSYEEIGMEDITTMVNEIVASRKGNGDCNKVTIVSHGTGGNSALVAASSSTLNFASKVGKIITIGPCLQVNIDEFWLPVRDLRSIEAFYASLAAFNIYSLFGSGVDANLTAYCNSGSVNTLICNAYILPAL